MPEKQTEPAPVMPTISHTSEIWQTLSVRAPVVGLMLAFLWMWFELEKVEAVDTAAHVKELTQIVHDCAGNSNP